MAENLFESLETEETEIKQKGLTVFEAALALISFVIGGGIVSIPYAVANCGWKTAIAMNLVVAVCGYWSGLLYIKAKMMCPIPVLTLYELGYVATGKWSIYLISFIAAMNNVGSVIVYFIIMGDLGAQISLKLFFSENQNIMTTRTFWVIIFATALVPIVIKKVINDFKWVSYTLFGALVMFVLFFAYQLAANGPYQKESNEVVSSPTNLGRI